MTKFVQDQFLESASGAVVKNIRAEIVKKTKLPIPPLSEQKAIAAKVEKLLTLNRATNMNKCRYQCISSCRTSCALECDVMLTSKDELEDCSEAQGAKVRIESSR